jgi:Fe-Mn family superoxide dismutase
MKVAAGAGAALALASVQNSFVFGQTAKVAPPAAKAISMIKLPYPENALEPAISARTVNLHYTKHHQSFYDTLKAYVDSHPEYQNMTNEELLQKYKDGINLDETIFFVSVLLNNHNWYWQSLKPKAGGAPKGKMEKLITAAYGSYDGFKKAFIAEAGKLGAGWVWVVQDGDKVMVYRSEYHDTPLVKGYNPLLAIDVWEHAYYLDYQDERAKYVEAVLAGLLNWEFAEKNLVQKKK